MCSTESYALYNSQSPQFIHGHPHFPSLARTLTYSCPVLQYPGPFYTTMLVVPTAGSPHSGNLIRNIGPVRGDHAAIRCDPNARPCLRPSPGMTGPCWPLSPSVASTLPHRPLSLHFEALPSRPPTVNTTPRRAPSPVRMGLATNPRIRRRSAEPQPALLQTAPPPLVWMGSPAEDDERVPDTGRTGPIKQRPSRRSSGAKELLQLLKRSAKKKMDRIRRSLSTERLSGQQRSRSAILRSPDGSEVAVSVAQRRRISSPVMPPVVDAPSDAERVGETPELLEDTFPRARLIQIHEDGSHTVRLVRHPCYAFGFFVSLDRDRSPPSQGMFISRMVHPQLEERLAGLLDVGDELLTVENVSCSLLTLEELQAIVGSRLVIELRVQSRPFL